MVLEGCTTNKNELTCKTNGNKIQEILLQEEVNFKLGNMNDNYGIINFDLVYDIKVVHNLTFPITITANIRNLIENVTDSGSTIAYQIEAPAFKMKFTPFFYLNFTNGKQKCFFKDNNGFLLVCEIIGDGETNLEMIEEPITMNFLEMNVIITPVINKQKISVSKTGAFFDFVYPNKLNYNFGSSFTIRYITPSPEKIKNIKLDIDSPSSLECEDLVGMKKYIVPSEHFKPTEEESFIAPTYYLNHLNSYSAKYEIDNIKIFTKDPPQVYLNFNITDENNKNIIKVGTNGILYLVTDYFDTKNVINKTILESYEIPVDIKYSSETKNEVLRADCRFWKSNSINIMMICKLRKNFPSGEFIISFDEINVRLGRVYNITLNYLAKNIKVKQLDNYLPFIYSDKYEIDLNQNVDYYSFEFNHFNYENHKGSHIPLFLYKTNMKSDFLNITQYGSSSKIYCNIGKKALIDILSFSGEKFNIAFPSKTEGLYVARFVEIVINYKIGKKEISLKIGNLLTKSIYKDEFIAYETNVENIDNIATLTTDYFDINTIKNDKMKCMFKKSNNQDKLYFLCNADFTGKSSLGKLELVSLDNINILYKLTIKESENNEIFQVYDENNGTKISGVSPLTLNFTEGTSNSFTITYATENPDGFNKVKFSIDSNELKCEKNVGYINCIANKDHFKSGTGYYYTYHSNPLGESVISYETPRIYAIFPEKSNSKLWLIIGLSVGGVVIVVGIIILIVCIRRKKKRENIDVKETLPLSPATDNE